MDANLAHPQTHVLLKTLIARSNGAEELLQRGLSYLKQPGTKHHQNIIGVLLKPGKAESKYVEIAIDFLNSRNPEKHKKFVYYNLTESLVYNPENAFEYLYGVFPDSRKDIICKAISNGLKRKPHLLHNFIEKWSNILYSKYQGCILAGLIHRMVESPELDLFIVNWLNNYYRKPGYGKLVYAISTSSGLKERLKALVTLSEKVVMDIDNF